MKFSFAHMNINVTNLEKSMKFYEEALGLKEVSRIEPDNKNFIIVYLGDGNGNFKLELTWLKEHPQKYDLGENEFHLAFYTDDMEAAFKKHSDMNCVVYENKAMGIYFIEDPDGYWMEVVPSSMK